MGAIAPSKMPMAKTVVRKDNPNDVTMYAGGGMAKDKPIPAKKLAAAAKAPGKLGQRARLAQTLKKMK